MPRKADKQFSKACKELIKSVAKKRVLKAASKLTAFDRLRALSTQSGGCMGSETVSEDEGESLVVKRPRKDFNIEDLFKMDE